MNNFIEMLLTRMQENGVKNCQVYSIHNIITTLNTYQGEVEKYIVADEQGLSISGEVDGKLGCTYIELIDEDSIDFTIKNIKDSASSNDVMPIPNVFDGKMKNICEIEAFDFDKAVDKLLNAEKIIRDYAKRVSFSIEHREKTVSLYNSYGARMTENNCSITASVSVVVQNSSADNNAHANTVSERLSTIDFQSLAQKALSDAKGMDNASPVKTGMYEILLRNDAAANLFEAFMQAFFADKVQKRMSKLSAVGQIIASPCLSIVEDPRLQNASEKRDFDDEGNPTVKKHLVKNGVLENLFYDRTSANKENKSISSNGFRDSYKSNITTEFTNCYIVAGKLKDTNQLISEIKDGLFITWLEGIFAGVNMVTGDFSLLANGYYVRNGQIVQAVNKITVGGNFYDFIKQIDELSTDVAINSHGKYFSSPSIKLKKLMVGGL